MWDLLLFPAGVAILCVGLATVIARIWLVQDAAVADEAAAGESAAAVVKSESTEEARVRLQARLERSQRRVLESRMDWINRGDAKNKSTTWPTSGVDRGYRFTGCMSLADAGHREEKPVPMPLLQAVRAWLEALGFEIAEDGLSAVYREPCTEKERRQ
jgi:hypothetical protein